MALAVAVELGGLEVVAAMRPVLHRDELAAMHAVAQLVGGAVELPRGLLRAEQRVGTRCRDGGGSGGDGQTPPPLFQGGEREGRERLGR
jgi:hypothetical protein